MLKNIAKLELKIGERVYQFLLDADSPLVEVKDVLIKYMSYVTQIEDSVKAQQEAAKAAEVAKAQDQSSDTSKVESIPEKT